MDEMQTLEQPTKLPPMQYYGLLIFLTIALGVLVTCTALTLLGT